MRRLIVASTATLSLVLALVAASGQATAPSRGLLSVLHAGQSVTLKEAGGRFEIGIFEKGPPPPGHKVVEVGGDYVVVQVPVRVMIAPIVPGLTDHELPRIMEAAAEAGAFGVGYTLLRLPPAVEPIFLDWLARRYPDKRERVESLVRQTRDGKLYRAEWGTSMRGTGTYAEQIKQSFNVFRRKFGLDRPSPEFDLTLFRPPRASGGQQTLF